jgi:hypothetical protein
MASTCLLLSRRDGKKSLLRTRWQVNKLPRESIFSGSQIILRWTLILLKNREMGKSRTLTPLLTPMRNKERSIKGYLHLPCPGSCHRKK